MANKTFTSSSPLGSSVETSEIADLAVTAAKLAAMDISALTSNSGQRFLVGVHDGFMNETGSVSTTSTSYGAVGDAMPITQARFAAPTGTSFAYYIMVYFKNQNATSTEVELRDTTAGSSVGSSEITTALSNSSDFQTAGPLTLTDTNRHQFRLKISGSGTGHMHWGQILVFALVD